MKKELLEKAISLAEEVGFVFVTTADLKGLPHLTAANRCELKENGLLSLSCWFCPSTLANLQINPNVTVVAWKAENDKGYQIEGKAKTINELAMLDGFDREKEEGAGFPQVESELEMEVSRVTIFKKAPHTDSEA
ncbi:MAG: pyridoxamine 5'-phosphate oxidase family protein [Candidatus Omnitrophota bacterium]